MSVFGGDSWGREAQYRKRRVDDVVLDNINPFSYQKLASGKFACLICPHSPILDTSLMLSMHCKGSCHLVSESRIRETECATQNEIKKRLALTDPSIGYTNAVTPGKKVKLAAEPLIEQTKKTTYETLHNQARVQDSTNQNFNVKSCEGYVTDTKNDFSENSSCPAVIAPERWLKQTQLDSRERRERELKFIEAGWKRDCHGGWYRDENVEFDSDEEDPNVRLIEIANEGQSPGL